MDDKTILNGERDRAYAHWLKQLDGMNALDRSEYGQQTTRETWCAAWEYAMDVATKCVQLMDAGYKSGKTN